MSKAEHLKEYIIRDVIEYYVVDSGLSAKEALSKFCCSEVFGKLDDNETELYLCSSAYVYDLFSDEMKHGKVVQYEI